MEIYVILFDGQLINLCVKGTDTFAIVKTYIQKQQRPYKGRFVFKGEEFKNEDMMLKDCKIETGSTLHLVCHIHENGNPDIIGYSGLDDNSIDFLNHYNLQPKFLLSCSACCISYLVNKRQYTLLEKESLSIVCYSNLVNPHTLTSSYLTGPSEQDGLIHGQFATGEDINEGLPLHRKVTNSLTYQLYTKEDEYNPLYPPVGPFSQRIESIGFDVLQKSDVEKSYLNYCNATLIELLLEANGSNSWAGIVKFKRCNY